MNTVERMMDAYAYLFSRKKFYRFNKALFLLSLRGLGVLNHRNDVVSGESHFLNTYLGKARDPVVFDVGANEGNYTSAVLSANPASQVYAFEPHPVTFQALAARLLPHGVQVVNAACGREAGELLLYDYAASDSANGAAMGSQHASLYKGVIEDLRKGSSSAHKVSVIDLDTFVNERAIESVDLLKIDTEGHEFEVINGATQLLRGRKVKAIQFEFNEMNLISRTFMRDFFAALPEYDFYRTVRDGLIPLRQTPPFLSEIFIFQNIVALLRPPS